MNTPKLNTNTLNANDKRDLYNQYMAGSLTVEQLAVKYGLTDEQMFNILFEGKSL
jgi:hypothetical protein